MAQEAQGQDILERMRLGPLILQLCAVLIACAIICGGYVWYRQSQVSAFEAKLKALGESKVLVDVTELYASAPSSICMNYDTGFSTGGQSVRYFHDGKVRLSATSLTGEKVIDTLIDETGIYIWSFGTQKEIMFFPAGSKSAVDINQIVPESQSVLSGSYCEIWWWPNEKVFEIPANLPIVDYSQS